MAVLVDRDGNFNGKIQEDLKLDAGSSPVFVVAIMGVQSTGKSTILNHLFDTRFRVMDADQGIHKTTEGIYVAKSPLRLPYGGPGILVVDTEGSDGFEREDDTKFEKQAALFALAISDTVIINMKCGAINLNNGASMPLLRTIFEVMLKKFSTPRKVNLVFVLRDKTKSPFDKLEEQLKTTIRKLWVGITNAAIEDYFKIKVVAMSNYEEKREHFENEVAALKHWIISNSTSGGVAAGRIPASAFADYAKKIWDEIKENKDLDLPSYRILVAGELCNRISQERYQSFCEDKTWLQIENDVKLGAEVQRFGETVSSRIDTCLSLYKQKARYYGKTIRDKYERQLNENILKVVQPTHFSLVERMRRAILQNFEEEAMDELKRNGILMTMNIIHIFVNKFEIQLRDADIKQANWNQTTEQSSRLKSELSRCIKEVHKTYEQFKQQKIMDAELRCIKIAREKFQGFCENKFWLQIESAVKSGAEVQGFGKNVSLLIDTCLSLYDKEAPRYDETKRDEYKRLLIENILKVVKPTHFSLVERMRRAILQNFEDEAMDELERNGTLMTMNIIQKFVNKFENQLPDADIKQANWNQTPEQLSRLKSELHRCEKEVHKKYEQLKQQKIMEAELRCSKIAQEKFQCFCENKFWLQVESDVRSGAEVQGFGKNVSLLIDTCLSMYDKEARCYDETKRDEHKRHLLENILKVVKPTYFSLVERMIRAILQNFVEEVTDEVNRNVVLMPMNMNKFVNKFEYQLRDADIKQANFSQTTEQLSRQLKSNLATYIKGVSERIELQKQQKRDRRVFLWDVALFGGTVLVGAGGVAAVSIIAPQCAAPVVIQIFAVASALFVRVANRNNKAKLDLPVHAKSI